MAEITADGLASYLSGRLAPDVSVSDLVEHVEGWSRDTVSFTASWDGGERRLVIRAESESQAAGAEDTPSNDVGTEFRVMDAVQDTGTPVPETLWYEPDTDHFGRPFFLVEHLPGEAPVVWDPRDRRELYGAWDSPDRTLPDEFVDATAAIHSLGPDDVPFLEATPADGIVDRELDAWIGVYRDAAIADEPAVEEAIRWFRANEPAIDERTLIHGDYRIGNMLVDDDGITGVLDWELARIGDPMYDLGYASTRYFSGKLVEPIERPELACSLVERDWFYDEYEERTGRTVDRERVRYWRAFGAFFMMTVSMAGAGRYRRGESDDLRSAWLQYTVPGLIEDILAIVREDRV